MRIAFLGKGGSGKTTTAAGFVRYAAKKHPFVLAIDADVNVHMQQALNLSIDNSQLELGNANKDVKDYLRGNRVDLGDRPMAASTPPSLKSNFVMVSPDDPFIRKYGRTDGNVSLLTVGTYQDSDVGASCYHGKLDTLGCVMHHMLDTDNDIVIADTTAGTDIVSTSLYLVYDLHVFVIEPTEKSVQVYTDFIELAPQLAERTFVIANKVDGKNDEQFINSVIPKEKLLGLIPLSKNLKRFEQGQKNALEEFQAEQSLVFDAVYLTLKQRKRNWTDYLKQLRYAHKKVSQRWLNSYFSTQMDADLDEDFDYELALVKELERRKVASSSEQKTLELTSARR